MSGLFDVEDDRPFDDAFERAMAEEARAARLAAETIPAPPPLSRLGRVALLAATELGGVDAQSLPLAGRIVRADDEELPS